MKAFIAAAVMAAVFAASADMGASGDTPKLLFFRSERCSRCIRLEKELFSTQKWVDFAEGRITLERVDMGGIDENPVAARFEIDRKGSFVLTDADGGRALARLEACDDPSAVIPWLSAALASVGGRPATELFNGKDLSGWVSVADNDATGGYSAGEPTWSVVDGAIRTTGTPFGYLRTKRADFGDFKLKLQYRWWRRTEHPNSGIFVRLSGETGTFVPTCYENQLDPNGACSIFALGGSVLEGVAPRTPYNPADALSGIAAAPRKVPSAEKAFGEWNELEIEARGDELVSRLNGVEMNRVKGVKTPKGAIALQSEGGAIEFRSVVVEE